jgi:hypothetical protein
MFHSAANVLINVILRKSQFFTRVFIGPLCIWEAIPFKGAIFQWSSGYSYPQF